MLYQSRHAERDHIKAMRVVAPLLLLVSSTVFGADDKSLWQIQKVLASKKYVDLTHEFAPGIPRWPGFPDETRKIIYWYDKRPDTMGSGFFSELFTRTSANGARTQIRRHISLKACAPSIRSTRRKCCCRWSLSMCMRNPRKILITHSHWTA